jgi:hypothetical protein
MMPKRRRGQQAERLRRVIDDEYQRDRKELNILTMEAWMGVVAAEMRRRKAVEAATKKEGVDESDV